MNENPTGELEEIAKKLADSKFVPPMTVRAFLQLFGQERRGQNVVKRIRKELKKHKLATRPDFENENSDNPVEIVLMPAVVKKAPIDKERKPTTENETSPVADSNFAAENDEETKPRDSVVTIRQGIPSAGRAPATVRPTETTKMALTRMMAEKLELLVVQSGDRARVEGIFSYASFIHAQMAGKPTATVGDCISRDFIEVNEEEPLIDAVQKIMRYRNVMVRARDQKVCGLVTARDVAPVFVGLAEPFLLLGQIENYMRCLIERAQLKKEEYQSLVISTDPKRQAKTEGADHLTLGELIFAFEKDDIWEKAGLIFDKATFTKRLHDVREIRNKVMHFSPDSLPAEEIIQLKDARELLEKL